MPSTWSFAEKTLQWVILDSELWAASPSGPVGDGGSAPTLGSMRSPKDFFRPLAVGAPEPLREIPARPSRMIHFFPSSNAKLVAKVPQIAPTVDVLLANLEDGVPAADKIAARAGLVEVATSWSTPGTQLWTRVNSLDSPWGLDDLTTAVLEAGHALDVVMIPKVESPADIHYVDRLLAQLEAKAGLRRPILVHAILETARGVAEVEAICAASPRMQGLSLGPADLAANRRMKTTRVGGGHPGYLVRQDPPESGSELPRATFQQDLWHYTIARMVDACVSNGIFPYYGPFGDIADTVACEDQFRNASCSAASAPGACIRPRYPLPRRFSVPTRQTFGTLSGSWRRWATAPGRSCWTVGWRTTHRSSSAR